MNKIFLLVIVSVNCCTTIFGQQKKSRLQRAIICLTYDDGLESQLTTVIPQLDSIGLKATFFLNSIQGSSLSSVIGHSPESVLGWTHAANNGHELANHTLFHPCPEQIGWDKSVSIDTYTVDRIIQEIKTQSALLSLLDPGRKQRSFAFPCGNYLIGDTDYIPIIKKLGLITYARGGGDSTSILANFKKLIP
ncbi:MAG: polysaccharide deacetylase family protein [Chitinophagaceae bacterium]